MRGGGRSAQWGLGTGNWELGTGNWGLGTGNWDWELRTANILPLGRCTHWILETLVNKLAVCFESRRGEGVLAEFVFPALGRRRINPCITRCLSACIVSTDRLASSSQMNQVCMHARAMTTKLRGSTRHS